MKNFKWLALILVGICIFGTIAGCSQQAPQGQPSQTEQPSQAEQPAQKTETVALKQVRAELAEVGIRF
jgi:hypothetical protein